MKTNHYLTLSAVIVSGLVSCTSEELVSEIVQTGKTNEQTVMSFDVHTKNQTRAETGALQSSYYDFGVWAYKKMPEGTTDGDYKPVMQNYLVGYYDIKNSRGYYGNATPTIGDNNYADNGHYNDGVSLWFYAGLGSSEYNSSKSISSSYEQESKSINSTQTIQNWDYNSNSTDFFAYAPYGDGNLYEFSTAYNDTVIKTTNWVWAGFSNQNYQEKLLAYTNVAKSDYGNDVKLQFKRINAAVQLAFYAPIPGFWTEVTSIVVESAHEEANGNIVTSNDDKVNYGCKVKMGNNGNIVLVDSALYHIKTDNSTNTFGAVTGVETVTNATHTSLTNALGSENTKLSYAANIFYAMPASTEEADKNSGFKVSVKFKIYSWSTEETQELEGEVFIPKTYTQWKSNYKYVYIFKLTHNTPIVFDGITVSNYDTEEIPADWTVVGTSNP